MNLPIKRSCTLGIVFLLLFAACQGQTTRNDKQPAATVPGLIEDFDPYFVKTRDTISTHGPQSITRNILQDKNGHYWMASWEGIIEYDGKNFINHTLKDGLRQHHMFSVLEDKSGNLWFGSIGAGVYRYDGKTFVNFTPDDGLAGESVGSMMADPAGNVWLATNKGLSLYNGKTITTFPEQTAVANADINSLYQDNTGKIWIGAGEGMFCYDGSTFTPFLNPEGEPFKNVRCVIGDKKGNIWMGGSDGLYCFDGVTNKKITADFTGRMYEDKSGTIWTAASGANGMVVYRYNGKTLTRFLDEDADDTYYGKSFKTMKAEGNRSGGQIFCFLEDNAGDMWFCTDGGVTRYDGKGFYKM